MSFYQVSYKSELSVKNRMLRFLWNVVQFFLFQPGPRRLHSWRACCLRCFGAKVGKQVSIYPHVKIYAPWQLEMKDRACLAEGVNCYNVDQVIIEEDAVVSEGAFLCTASHNIDSHGRELITKAIRLEEGSWVFAEAFIGPGVTVKKGAIVGARAVVTKDVQEMTVVAGNPAREIRKRRLDDVCA
ncbi:putative colanic acid biosynthesis acetyltransferase [Kiritimatiellota bacterium B12222]|nr:putative colanic acid biosynthesis acetyltransferase [Kiritimatiellota bacterium B12222]